MTSGQAKSENIFAEGILTRVGGGVMPPQTRPSWNQYFIGIARAVALRADCRRAKYGAVLVKDNRILSTGYNGAPSGRGSCLEGDCPRGMKSVEELAHNSPGYADCIGLHAEQNCIAYANRADCDGATMYIAGGMPPCDMCRKLLISAGVRWVIYENGEFVDGEQL